jgi:MarR family transcriptional regulator, organic hydroperoxide resistance regulator
MYESDSLDRLMAQVCRLHHGRAHTLLEALGLYRGQPPLLHIVAHNEGLSHSDIAARMHVTPATVSKMISRMEKNGILLTRSDPQDQRVSRVYLQEGGRALLREADGQMQQLDVESFAGFTDEEREQMRDYLFRIRDNLLAVMGESVCGPPHKGCEE